MVVPLFQLVSKNYTEFRRAMQKISAYHASCTEKVIPNPMMRFAEKSVFSKKFGITIFSV